MTAGAHAAILVLSATAFETAALRERLSVGEGSGPWPGWPDVVRGSLPGDGRAPHVPVMLAISGVGKANAAAAVASVVAASHGAVAAVLQVGIGGAYPGAGLALGEAVLARSEFDLDLGVGTRPHWSGLASLGFAAFSHADEPNRLDLESEALRAVRSATGLRSAAFATSDSVTADRELAASLADSHAVEVESMEGVAAAQAAAAFAVPFVELRAISNLVGERDKSRWVIGDAVRAASQAAVAALPALWDRVAGR